MKCGLEGGGSQPGPGPGAPPALAQDPWPSPFPGCLSARRVYWKAAVVTLFSMQRTIRALWQPTVFCPSSLPVCSGDAWPAAPAASVRQVSQ